MRQLVEFPLLFGALLTIGEIGLAQRDGQGDGASIIVNAPVVALIGVRVIDGTGRPSVESQTIVISNGRIAAVGSESVVEIPADAERLDLTGRSVLPGLVMLHEHLNYFSGRAVWHPQPISFPPLYLAAGVTTIRTAGTESPFVDLNLKRRIDEGRAVGPKLHLTGPMFNGVAGDFLGDLVVSTAEEARRAVDYWAGLGFTSFKVYTDIAPEVLAAVVEATHARGLTVAGHLGSVTCRNAATLGIDTIEHSFACSELEQDQPEPADPRVADLIHHLVAEGTVLVSTPMDPSQPLSSEELDALHPESREQYLRGAIDPPAWWPDPEEERWQRRLERAFAAAGGHLGVGADPGNTGVVAGYADHRALALLVEAGWEPMEVLRLATSNNAEILGIGDEIGRIAVGFAADLMVIPGDPSVDINDLSKVEIVFKDGVGYSPEALKASVKGKVGWH